MAVRPRFDPNRDFVAARGFTFKGATIEKAAPFDKSKADRTRLAMLYESRMIDFAPEQTGDAPVDDGIALSPIGGGYYHLTAPWLDEPIKLRGKVNAEAELARVREEGEPDAHHGVTLTRGENGWWTVSAEWDPENVATAHGEEAARDLATAWRAEGPPKDSVTVTPGDKDGEFVVTALWLDQAETYATAEEAEARAVQLRTDGPPALEPVTVEEGAIGGEAEGRFVVSAAWLGDDARETFDDRDAAEARAAELREAGPPEDWEPPAPEPADPPAA